MLEEKNKDSKEKRVKIEIPRLIYFVLVSVLTALIVVLITNFLYLQVFIKESQENTMTFQVIQGRRISYIIENFISERVNSLEQLSYVLAQEDRESQKSQDILNNFSERYPETAFLFVFNVEGVEIAKSINPDKPFIERGLSSSKTFNWAISNESFVSEVLFSERGEPYVRIGIPIFNNKKREMEGVLIGGVSIEKICDIVPGMKLEESGRILIVDDKGNLIAGPDSQKVLEKLNLINLTPVRATVVGKEFKDLKRGGEYQNEEGNLVIGIGVPIKKLNWGVIIEQDSSEFRSIERDAKFLAFLLTGTALILILVLSWSIKVLIGASKTIRGYQSQLEGAKIGLEEEVKDRTKELAEKVKELEKWRRLTTGRELRMAELKKEIKKLKEKYEELAFKTGRKVN